MDTFRPARPEMSNRMFFTILAFGVLCATALSVIAVSMLEASDDPPPCYRVSAPLNGSFVADQRLTGASRGPDAAGQSRWYMAGEHGGLWVGFARPDLDFRYTVRVLPLDAKARSLTLDQRSKVDGVLLSGLDPDSPAARSAHRCALEA